MKKRTTAAELNQFIHTDIAGRAEVNVNVKKKQRKIHDDTMNKNQENDLDKRVNYDWVDVRVFQVKHRAGPY